jgi:hypothetical protein
MLDAVNFDSLQELLYRGETMTSAQQAVAPELEEKLVALAIAACGRSGLR